MGSSDGQAGQANVAKEEEFDDTDLRREFCARVLITTQLAEGKWAMGSGGGKVDHTTYLSHS